MKTLESQCLIAGGNKMRMIILLFFALIGNYDFGQENGIRLIYKGPNVLGPFHIDRITTVESMFKVLGSQSANKKYYCYQNSNVYFWFERNSHHLKDVGDVFLSSFANCVDSSAQITTEMLSNWKTENGIGIGGTIKDVIAAYGKPLKDEKIVGTAFRSLIQGDYLVKENRYSNIQRPELGERALIYGSTDDFRSAAFGINKGKIVWISLSNSE
jgi:hypothetical protein